MVILYGKQDGRAHMLLFSVTPGDRRHMAVISPLDLKFVCSYISITFIRETNARIIAHL